MSIELRVSDGPYQGAIIHLDETPSLTDDKIKKVVEDYFGLPSSKQTLLLDGQVMDTSNCSISGALPLLIRSDFRNLATKSPLHADHEFLDNLINSPQKNVDLFAKHYQNCLQTWEKNKCSYPNIQLPIHKKEILRQIPDKTDLVTEFIKTHLTDTFINWMHVEQINRNRLLSPNLSPQEKKQLQQLLTILMNTPFIQKEVSSLRENRIEILQSYLWEGHFEESSFPEVIETYADQRAEKKGDPIRLFYLKQEELLPLLKQALEHKNAFHTPFRFQCLMDFGHITCLDFQIDSKTQTCVVLDSISEVMGELKELVMTMIDQWNFRIYVALSTVFNQNQYQIVIKKEPPSLPEILCNQKISLSYNHPALMMFWQTTNETSKENQWFYHCEGMNEPMQTTDSSLLNKLNTLELTSDRMVSRQSDWMNAILKSALPCPQIGTVEMQKDNTSCPAFALHFAIQAGKRRDFHELCHQLSLEKNPAFPYLIKRILPITSSHPKQISPISWHDLPDKFLQWSQSQTFYPNRRIDPCCYTAMQEKIRKRDCTITHLETHPERMERFLSLQKEPSSAKRRKLS